MTNTHDPPTMEQVRAQLWEVNQRLFSQVGEDAARIGFLQGTLIGVRDELSGSDPNIPHLIAVIDSALKEKPNAG